MRPVGVETRSGAAGSRSYRVGSSKRAGSCSTVVHRTRRPRRPTSRFPVELQSGKVRAPAAPRINGRPALMCMTRMSTLGGPTSPSRVSPMRAFPIMRGPL